MRELNAKLVPSSGQDINIDGLVPVIVQVVEGFRTLIDAAADCNVIFHPGGRDADRHCKRKTEVQVRSSD